MGDNLLELAGHPITNGTESLDQAVLILKSLERHGVTAIGAAAASVLHGSDDRPTATMRTATPSPPHHDCPVDSVTPAPVTSGWASLS